MADLTPQQFAAALLRKLGIHQTPGAIQALVGWENAEGGNWHNQARFNPLNTTQNAPGAGNTGSQGNIKVYRNWDQGLDATAQTLRNGRYGGILNALQAGNPGAVASAIDRSPWGTHGPLVYNAIKGAPRVAGVHVPSVGGSAPASSARSARTTTTTTTPGVDNSGLRRQALASFLLGSGTPDPTTGLPSSGSGDILDFALQMKQLADVPGQASTAQAGRTAPRTPSGGSGSASFSTPKAQSGTANFEGKKVAAWIAPALDYARRHGWNGTVTSGYRSFADQTRIYNSGVRPAARPGTSNHEGADFPRGAVDVTDAQTLSNILQRSPYGGRLKWAGAKDPVHFSHPHNGSY